MAKEVPLFLPMTRAETQMLRGADELWEKRTKRTRDVQTLLPPNEAKNQESPELREKSIEEVQKAAITMQEEEDHLIFPADELWTIRSREWLRAAHTKKEEPQIPPGKPSEPKVYLTTAALRKQYADIQSKISPAKPATPKSKFTSPACAAP